MHIIVSNVNVQSFTFVGEFGKVFLAAMISAVNLIATFCSTI